MAELKMIQPVEKVLYLGELPIAPDLEVLIGELTDGDEIVLQLTTSDFTDRSDTPDRTVWSYSVLTALQQVTNYDVSIADVDGTFYGNVRLNWAVRFDVIDIVTVSETATMTAARGPKKTRFF